jgi:uncharacterized protein YndB with AHSA1/START domain
MATDVIQKKILLHASLSRVWRALSDSKEFGTWFGMEFDGPFSPGASMRGVITPTQVNAKVARAQESYAGLAFEMSIVQMEHDRLFSFRWHPNAIEPGVDYSAEPTTLVVFELERMENGVMCTVTESGFDQIPLERRAKAFAANEGGWTIVIGLIGDYLAQPQ